MLIYSFIEVVFTLKIERRVITTVVNSIPSLKCETQTDTFTKFLFQDYDISIRLILKFSFQYAQTPTEISLLD